MVHALAALPSVDEDKIARRVRLRNHAAAGRLMVGLALMVAGGCASAPRARMDECQRLTQTLRSENARMKDRLLAVQSQNRDYAERAVDDSKRLTIQDEAIDRLEHSVQAYQDERTTLEAAYQQLASSLGVSDGNADKRQAPAAMHSSTDDGSRPAATARNSGGRSTTRDETTPQ
jgi:chromosome segregation ATPase